MSELPEGFVLDQQAPPQGGAGLPEGFQLDNQPAQQPPEPHKFGLADTWPVRLAKSVYKAVTLPGDVLAGKVDPLSQEGIERSADIAQIFNPVEPGITAGRGALGAIRSAKAPVELPANVQAAQAAVDAGAPLPSGLVSPNPVTRATTQAAASLPLVGPKIGHAVEKSVEAAGEKVGDLATALRQGAVGRADVGEAVRPGIQGAIDKNNAAMSAEYDGVRGMFDTSQQFELPHTKAALDRVMTARQAAKQTNPEAGLGNVANLVKQPAAPEMGPTVLRGMEGLQDQAAAQPWGASFEGLQRARSDFGRKTQFGEPNPGYSEGERKFLYGAMSRDMENIARQGGGEQAVNALQAANANAGKYIEQNATLQKLVNKTSNESLAGSIMGAAREKGGNLDLLTQLRRQMPPEQFQTVSGQVLSELGHNPATGSFSLNQFTTQWNKLGNDAKAVLFEEGHKKTLDGIAKMGEFLKNADKYRNTSNTGHSVGVFAILEHMGEAASEALTGNVKPLVGSVAGLAGGAMLGKWLARPATASAVARWTRAAEVYDRSPSIARRVTVNLATKSLLDNIADAGGLTRNQLALALGQALGPQQAAANSNAPSPQGGAVQRQIGQVR